MAADAGGWSAQLAQATAQLEASRQEVVSLERQLQQLRAHQVAQSSQATKDAQEAAQQLTDVLVDLESAHSALLQAQEDRQNAVQRATAAAALQKQSIT